MRHWAAAMTLIVVALLSVGGSVAIVVAAIVYDRPGMAWWALVLLILWPDFKFRSDGKADE